MTTTNGVNGHANGAYGKSTFQRQFKRLVKDEQQRLSEIVSPRFVVKLTDGRDLVVYAADATAARATLIQNGFDTYERRRVVNQKGELEEKLVPPLLHVSVKPEDILSVEAAGGIRRDGTYDFGGKGTTLIADNNPSRETQSGKPALK